MKPTMLCQQKRYLPAGKVSLLVSYLTIINRNFLYNEQHQIHVSLAYFIWTER